MTNCSSWTVWLTGLPASGKSTIAHALQERLAQQGIVAIILDSDELRAILTPQAAYSPEERDDFYASVTGLAALLNCQRLNVIIAATGNLHRYRQAAKDRLNRFYEVWIQCPVDLCRQRDPKGLYAQAALQKESTLPGIGAPYEPPLAPALTINTETDGPTVAAEQIISTCALASWPGYGLAD